MFLHISCESEKLESDILEETPIKLSHNGITEKSERKDISKNNLTIQPTQTINTNKEDKNSSLKKITITPTTIKPVKLISTPVKIKLTSIQKKSDSSKLNLSITPEKNILPTKIPIVDPIPSPSVTTPSPIPTSNQKPKLVQTENFKLIATHTPTPTSTPYPEIRIIFGNTVIGIVNEWSLLKGGFIERQNPDTEMTAKISWGDSKIEEFENLEIQWEGFTLSNMKKGYFKGRHIYTAEGDYDIKIIVKTETEEEFIIEGKALINFYN
jgi:hypothetical protein